MADEYVVIGDGNAGASAAKRIRELNGDVGVTVLTDEDMPLYNRIMLKNFMKGTLPKQYARVHTEDWYEDRGIDLKLSSRVVSVDTDENVVFTEDGESIGFDSLLVASGGSPKRHPADRGFENIYYMWTMNDAERVKNAAEDVDDAVVIGGGLLGIDLAVAFAKNGCNVDYLIKDDCWWNRGLDAKGAEIIHRKMDDIGINVVTDTFVDDFDVEDGEVVAAVSADGERFSCDAVGVAIGQTPNSGFIEVEKTANGLIKVDKFLETSEDNIFAAGNMVEYFSPVFEKRNVKGSWDHSEAMGLTAAENMVNGKEKVFNYLNTYGVGHFDVQFLAIGDWSAESVSKRFSDNEYRRLFFNGDRLVGAVLIGFTRGQEKIRELIKSKEKFDDREKLLDKDYW